MRFMVDADRKPANKDTFATVDGQSMSEFQLTPKTDGFPGSGIERDRERARSKKRAKIFERQIRWPRHYAVLARVLSLRVLHGLHYHVIVQHALLLRQLGPSGIIDPFLHHPNCRRDSHHKAPANGSGWRQCLCQVRGCEPRWIRQGSPRPWNDRMGREGGPP